MYCIYFIFYSPKYGIMLTELHWYKLVFHLRGKLIGGLCEITVNTFKNVHVDTYLDRK